MMMMQKADVRMSTLEKVVKVVSLHDSRVTSSSVMVNVYMQMSGWATQHQADQRLHSLVISESCWILPATRDWASLEKDVGGGEGSNAPVRPCCLGEHPIPARTIWKLKYRTNWQLAVHEVTQPHP